MNKYIAFSMLVMFVGCVPPSQPSSDTAQQRATKQVLTEANNQIGMPDITSFRERKLARDILELRDKELTTYTYLVGMQGNLVFLGESIGYGLPYSVQYTNPQRIVDADREADGVFTAGNDAFVLPQAEPNGLFSPDGLSATWVLLVNPETGKPQPLYVEPQIIVSPFKLH